MKFKIGGSLGKVVNRAKKMDLGDAALAAATGGVTLAHDLTQNKSLKDKVMSGVKGVTDTPKADIQAASSAGYVDAANNMLNPVADQYTQFGQTSAITSNVDPAFRQYQMQLAQQLQAQAAGQGPSLAQMQLQGATDQTMNNTIANMRAATGPNAALNARSVALAGAQQLGGAANQAAMLRLQEQQQAQNALAGLAAQGRQGDLTASAQSLQAQQATQANRLAGLQGLEGIRNKQVGVQGDIYGTTSAAKMKDSELDSTLKAQRSNTILGGIWNLGSAALGSLA